MSAVVAAGTESARRVLSGRWMLLGFCVFFLDRFFDSFYDLPLLNFVIPALLLYLYFAQRSDKRILTSDIALLGIGFVVWAAISLIVNQVPADDSARKIAVLVTMIAPIVLYIALPEKEAMMAFILGAIVGFGLYFSVVALWELSQGHLSRELRGVQPTPVVALALFFALRNEISRGVKLALVGTAALSFLLAIFIDARGPLLALGLALVLWPLASSPVSRRMLLPLIVVVALSAHLLFGLWGPVYERVVGSEFLTVSNAERAYLIDYSVARIFESPWVGMSPDYFPVAFAAAYGRLSFILREALGIETPHNSLLEYSVFYGLPAGLLFLAIIWRVTALAARSAAVNALVYALAIAGVIRLAAFYGISGWIRVEWFALIFVLFYASRTTAVVRTVEARRPRFASAGAGGRIALARSRVLG